MKVMRDWIADKRSNKYRTIPSLKIKTQEEAAAFVDENGLVSLFSCKDLELPSLFDAATIDDADKNAWWGWKDKLSQDKRAFYGRLLSKKAILSTWDLFECFYALSGSSGELDEYLYEFKQGRMGVIAKNIYEYLRDHGPTATDALRQAVKMSDKRVKHQFEKAMLDLQCSFFIAKVGWEDRRWGVDTWDLLPRWVPDHIEKALRISTADARRSVLGSYVSAVGVISSDGAKKSLGWNADDFAQAADYLLQSGQYVDVEIGEELVPAIGHAQFLEDLNLG